jgi:tRNA A-37 threonylcarbamoyl transferase component Bud32
VLIDLSLGSAQADAEGMAVDLKLAREALESTHPGADFGKLLDAYRKTSAEPGVLDRLEDLDSRGRYRRRGDARNA